MKATEFEFTSGERIYRTYLINDKWRVTMTENDQFFDRDQSREFLVDSEGNFKWSDMARWRVNVQSMDSLFDEEEGDPREADKYQLAEFDSPEEAQEEVAWFWIREDHKRKDDDDWF